MINFGSGRDGPDAVIVLAGGAGRRLGGADKGALLVGGSTLLDRALAAAAGRPVVVVGPPRALPAGVAAACEDPPGGGPAAGVAAGLAALESMLARPDSGHIDDRALIAVLAVDQPGVTGATLNRLAAALRAGDGADRSAGGAILVHGGQRQYTVGVFLAGALHWAVRQRPNWHGVALRSLVGALVGVEIPAVGDEAWDIDTVRDLRHWQAGGGSDTADGPP